MANLSNLDETVNIIIKLCSVYDEGKTAHETWLRTELSIFSKTINIEIGNNIGLMVNLHEAEELLRELQSLVDAYYRKEKQDITFCNNEMNFDFNMELLLEDDVVEIEMWINTANRTTGDILTRINDLSNVKEFVTQLFMSLFVDLILVLFVKY